MRVLTLPGWHGSGPEHWQTLWEQQSGYQRVQQHDWEQPLRGDWMMQLEEQLLQSEQPAVLVAHSLGCWLVAAWAGHSQHTERVKAALLVAPPDLQQQPLPQLYSWKGTDTRALPFPSLLLARRGSPLPLLVDQGDADNFLAEQLRPQTLYTAGMQASANLLLRMQPGYDHSYYFIASFIEEHLRFHAGYLQD